MQIQTQRGLSRGRLLAAATALAMTTTLLAGYPLTTQHAAADELSPRPITHEPADYVAPSSYPQQQPLPVPEASDDDASIARGVMPYHEIAPAINEVMAASDRVSAQVVGNSVEGRDIYLVTVTAPESETETARQAELRDRIRDDAASVTDAELAEYKVPVWVNANIHGNEWEGTDIALDSIRKLSTDTSEQTNELLANHRFYFTVSLNPDGRHNGTRRNAENYDANRDMITSATPESRVLRDLAPVIQPTFYIDLHGYTRVLQVEPTGPPHGENYEYDLFLPHAYDMALAAEQAVVEANIPGNTYLGEDGKPTETNTGKIKIPYRDIRQGWDDWPPIFTPQYLTFYGAITNTVELPHGRTDDTETNQRNSRINIEVGNVAMDSFIAYIGEKSDEVQANQLEVFRRGKAGEAKVNIPADIDPASVPEPNQWAEIWDETDVYTTEFPRAYVIPLGDTQRSETNAGLLVEQLLHHNIEVRQAPGEFTLGGVTYPAGSYVIDMHQPLRGLANALLADGQDISQRVPEMYDISAWSLPLLWGVTVDRHGTSGEALELPASDTVTAASAVTNSSVAEAAAGDYLELIPTGPIEYQAVNALLAAGIPVSVLDDGRFIIGTDAATADTVQQIVDRYGVRFSGTDGRALCEANRGYAQPRIGYVGAPEERFAFEQLGFTDLTEVSVAALEDGSVTLDSIDVLWIGDTARFKIEAGTNAEQQLRAYLDAGKGIAGEGETVATIATQFGVAEITAASGPDTSNGIVRVSDAADAPLLDDSLQTAFVYPATWYENLGSNVRVEQRYAESETFVSGHWGASDGGAVQDAAGKPSVVTVNADSDGPRMVLIGHTVNFRNHPIGSYLWIGRTIEWLAPAGTAATAPDCGEPQPTGTASPTEAPSKPTAAPTGPGETAMPTGTAGETAIPAGTPTADGRQESDAGALATTGAEVSMLPFGTMIVIFTVLGAALLLRERNRRRIDADS
ncbi:M14 family zinc carboxypeptidase [Gulosibacter sp. GYB002]|uniref:M14 family zinc carboxypeptidase n=1 Tax=Gulosibacter sp. GYB002 TaxID=2994391 RepID=UPI002F96ABF0